MKVPVYHLDGKKGAEIGLPSQFTTPLRADLIRRAFLAYQGNKRQPYGALPSAGQRASAFLSRRRRKFKTAYGIGISRVSRKALWKRGRRFGWVGAFAPGTVGGRRAHPPKSEKIWSKKINVKERRLALCSALAATAQPLLVAKRGHRFDHLINAVANDVEQLSKTKDVLAFLERIGLSKELSRARIKKVRAGVGKSRGRPYKKKKSILFVVSKSCPLVESAKNIPGIDISLVTHLNINLLAPGAQAGRLTLFSQAALEALEHHHLFIPLHKGGMQ